MPILSSINFLAAYNVIMGAGFGAFKQQMESFFKNGLGGEGAGGFGIAIAVIGLVCAGISFAVHKFNPQSKMPGWITCLVIGLVGAMLMAGVEKPLQLLKSAQETVYAWLGI